jgi:hypothetical protein
MPQWGYLLVQSQNGVVNAPSGQMSIPQMLNTVGSKGGELVTALLVGNGVIEFIFKFPTQPKPLNKRFS